MHEDRCTHEREIESEICFTTKKILLVRGKTVGSSEYSSRSASAMWFVLIQRYENSLVLSDEPNTHIRIF